MLSIVIPAPGTLELREAEMPVLQPGHAILRLLAGGICGSDLGTYKGTFLYAKYPRIPGHEFSAEIVEIGPNDRGLKPGMVVTANPYFNCGTCYSCRRGHVNCCEGNQTMGAQRDGAFSEYISMPVERVIDGRGLNPRTLALVEPYCIGYHAAVQARVRPGDRVLVVGAGAIGCYAAMAAQTMGGEVFICDIAPQKLTYAKSLGIHEAFCKDGENFAQQTKDLTDGCGFDVCIEAVGLPETFQNCVDAAAYCGRVVIVGIGKQSHNFFYSAIQTKELCIVGSRNALTADFEQAIALAADGKVKLDAIVSAEYPFTNAKAAFENLAANGGELLKVLLRFAAI